MQAIRVEQPHQLQIVEVPDPSPGAGEVLIRVQRTGICGSDIHIYHGANPFARYPRIIGHEVMGQVATCGTGVEDLPAGQRVVIDPVVSCGECYPCAIGRSNVCQNLQVIGVHRDGGMGQLMVAPRSNVYPIPDQLSARAATLVEPFSIAANVLSRTGIDAGEWVLIYGAGTVGITVLQTARMHGAHCMVVDIDPQRLQRAADLQAERTINSRQESVEMVVNELTGGLGPSLVIDGVGAPGLLEQAVALASPAGRIGILGFTGNPSAIPQQEITKKELSLFGSRLNRRLFPRVLEDLAAGRLDADALITHEFDFRAAADALRLLEEHPEQTCKIQLTFN